MRVDVHTYPSGTTFVKAFIANDFTYYIKKQHIIKDFSNASLSKAVLLKIIWWIQKNRQNNQAVTLVANIANPAICPVRSAMQMILPACWLNQPKDMPVAIYKMKKDKVFYLTGNKIAELLRKAVKAVRPDTAMDNLKKYSANLLCVWACVFLDKVGKSPKYIKERLRWLGYSFRMYLRDITKIRSQHLDALQAASQEVMDLITALPDKVIAMCTMTDGSDNPDMHQYADKMDYYISSSLQQLSAINNYLLISSKKLPPRPADTSQPHLVKVSFDIKLAYGACNNLIACSHPVLIHFPELHVHWMPTSWNPKFLQQDRIKANETVPIIWIHCRIYRRTHQIMQR
jgi:hypothetical protein